MVSPTTQKLLFTLVIVAMVALFSYSVFTKVPDAEINISDIPNTQIVGSDILLLVDQLERISIDQSIFSSPVFNSLVDLQTPIYAEIQGRPDPFAQIGQISSSLSKTSGSSKSGQ